MQSNMALFNINDGFVEAIVRGFRKGILGRSEYSNLEQCEVLDDIKIHLNSTDYADFLANEPSPLHTVTIAEKCTEKLVSEFIYIRANSAEPLTTFLDYITYGYMIDNIVLLITGTLHERDMKELQEKCHPLGLFEAMNVLCACKTINELYDYVLVSTPLANYFKASRMSEEDLDEMNIEIIRNTLYKAYLEDFYQYCISLGGDTADVMGKILSFEADRRSINITVNSFGTELQKSDRETMFPNFGMLYPEGIAKLAKAEDTEQVAAIVKAYEPYSNLYFESSDDGEKSLVDSFFAKEVKLNELSFEQQMHYGVFYSYIRLREQEIRNIVWIAECVSQKLHDKIKQYIPIFDDRRFT